MLQIFIVENDPLLARILKDMIEFGSPHRVIRAVGDVEHALAFIRHGRPDLALIDIHLSGNATGVEIAARAREVGVPALFTTANPLPFPVPELALGCLCKPYTLSTVAQSLRIAEQIIRGGGRNALVPAGLELY